MDISTSKISGLYTIKLKPLHDLRGVFQRTYCEEIFKSAGLPTHFVQCNLSKNIKRGTLRGMHYQKEPHQEGKLVRCSKGAIFDVIVDIRPNSPTFCQWQGFELTEDDNLQLYIGEGLAHGFQTLIDNSDVFYQMTEYYHPQSVAGVRYDDPCFSIQWPIEEKIIAEKDLNFADFVK